MQNKLKTTLAMRPLITPSEAYLLEGSVNYTILHYTDGTSEISSYTLKKFEKQLSSNTAFVRIHKSFLVNRNFIKEVMKTNVVLHSGAILPLARRRKL